MPGMVIQIGSDVQQGIRGVESVSLKLNEQKAILRSLQTQYAALSTEQARGAFGKELASDIKIANEEIKRLGAGSTSAFNNLGHSIGGILTPLRQLAFIIPGIGLAGLFNLAFLALEKFISSLSKLDTGVDHFKNLEDTIRGAEKSFVSASETVETLRINIELAKNGFISKSGVVKEYNETIGKTTGLVNSLEEAEAALTRGGAAYIQITFLKAAANIALGKAAELAFQSAVKAQEEIDENIKALARQPKLPKDTTGAGQVIPRVTDAEQAASNESTNKQLAIINASREKIIAANKKKAEDFKKIAKDFQTEAALLAAQFKFNFFDDTKLNKAAKETEKAVKQFIFKGFVELDIDPIIKEETLFDRFRNQLLEIQKLLKSQPEINIKIPAQAQILIDQRQAAADLKEAIKKVSSFSGILNVAEQFGKVTKETAAAAEAIDSLLTPAFQNLFDAILQGENPLKAFFSSLMRSVEQLIQKLIAAVIEAAILTALFPGGIGGVSGFGKIFGKILGFATGGMVSGPTLAAVGELSSVSNPEVIMPLDRLRSMIGGGAGNNVVVSVDGVIRGNDLALLAARTSRSQTRTMGR